MKLILLGMILGVVILAAAAYLYFSRGYAPVATAGPSMPFEETMAKMALHARIAKEAPANAPIAADEANLAAGAQIYRDQRAMCHGLAGQPESMTAAGMFPKPPQLFKGHGVTDDPAGETYWKVKNGIRLTGMPAYSPSLSDQQIWQVSLMLAQADKLPASAQKVLAEAPPLKH